MIKESIDTDFVVMKKNNFTVNLNNFNFESSFNFIPENSVKMLDDDTMVVELLNDLELTLIVMIGYPPTRQFIETDYSGVEMMKSMAWLASNQLKQLNTVKKYKKSDRIFNLTFEQVGSGRCITDLEGHIHEANNKFYEIIGYTQDEAFGLNIKDLTLQEDWMIDVVYKEKLLKGEIPYFSMEKRYLKRDGSIVWVNTTVTKMSGDEGEDDFLIGIVQDITNQKDADLDALTGLYNRRHMMSRIKDEVNRSNRNHQEFVLILADIDFFKKINDDYGHDCGDEVLQTFASLMKENVRISDSIGRWGGEEFLILLPDTDIASAQLIAERIRDSVEKEIFCYDGHQFKLSMTLGLSAYNEKLSIKEMIKVADSALYEGKKLGRNKVV
ncbi:sensor domain-containing diguanylate cyclase [Fusibacter bizertensis]